MNELVNLSQDLKTSSEKLSELTNLFKRYSHELDIDDLNELCVYAEVNRAQSQLLCHLIKNIINTYVPI